MAGLRINSGGSNPEFNHRINHMDSLQKVQRLKPELDNNPLMLVKELVVAFKEMSSDYKISSKQQIELFCKDITDFMVLNYGSQLGIGNTVVSSSALEDRWEELQNDYKCIPNKTHNVKDIWKKLSSLMSKQFITKKMINADQVSFNIHSNLKK